MASCSEAVQGVRVIDRLLGPAGARGFKERTRPGAHELARITQRATGNSDLDRGVIDLRPRPELLRNLEALAVGQHELGVDDDVDQRPRFR